MLMSQHAMRQAKLAKHVLQRVVRTPRAGAEVNSVMFMFERSNYRRHPPEAELGSWLGIAADSILQNENENGPCRPCSPRAPP